MNILKSSDWRFARIQLMLLDGLGKEIEQPVARAVKDAEMESHQSITTSVQVCCEVIDRSIVHVYRESVPLAL